MSSSPSSSSSATIVTATGDKGDNPDKEQDEVNKRLQLFRDVKFRLCDDVPDYERIKKLLVDGGGTIIYYLSDLCTHLIADSESNPEVTQAVEIYEKPVVKSDWVRSSIGSECLLPVRAFSPLKNQLFSHITVCPSNLCPQDVEAIWAMVTFFGGSFSPKLTNKCTHLIATKPSGSKYEKAMSLPDGVIAIVTPDWITDSVKNKSLCDAELYHPRLLILTPSATSSSHHRPISIESIEPDLIIKSNVPPVAKPSVPGPHNQPIVTAITTSQHVHVRNLQQPGGNSFVTTVSPTGHQSFGPNVRQQIRLLVPNAGQQQQHQVRMMHMQQQQQRQMRPQQMGHQNPQQQQQQQPVYQMDASGQVTGSGPRAVYLQPHQQSQVRPHPQSQQPQQPHQHQQQAIQAQGQPGVQFIQVRGQQQQQQPAGSYMTQDQYQQQLHQQSQQQPQPQTPAQKPANQVILQQRVQPPVHTLSANQNQQLLIQQQQQQQQRFVPVPGNNNNNPTGPQSRPMMQQQPGSQMIRSAVHMQPLVPQHNPQNIRPHNQQPLPPQQQQAQHQQQQQQSFVQNMGPGAGMQQQVQRVPQVRIRGPTAGGPHVIRGPGPGQQLQLPPGVQQQIITNADGTQQRIFVRHQHPHPQQQQQQQFGLQSVGPDAQVTTDGHVVRQSIRHPGVNWQSNQGQQVPGPQMQWQQNPQQQQPHQPPPQQQQPQPQLRPMSVVGPGLQNQQNPMSRFPPPATGQRFSSCQTVNQSHDPLVHHPQQQPQPSTAKSGVSPAVTGTISPSTASVSSSAGTAASKLAPRPPASASITASTAASANTSPAAAATAPQAHVVASKSSRVQSVSTPPSALMTLSSASSSPAPTPTSSCCPSVPQVTPKTKTALANLLNTRLAANNSSQSNNSSPGLLTRASNDTSSGSGSSNSSSPSSLVSPTTQNRPCPPPPHVSSAHSAVASRPMTASAVAATAVPVTVTPAVAATASAVTPAPGVTPPVMLPSGSMYHAIHDNLPPLDKYYVHEPGVKLPKSLCLSGLVFSLIGFQGSVGKQFMLTDDQRRHLRRRIQLLGGEFEEDVNDPRVTHVFTDSQKYAAAQQAVHQGKRLLNIYWLDDVLKDEAGLKAPWRAWHLPPSPIHPSHPLVKTMILATTGFSLPERQLIRELCAMIGLKYTPYMSQSNTILLCKQVDSEKYARAIEWLIPIVSGHWLVDLFFNVNDPLRMPLGSAHQRHRNFDASDPFEMDFRALRVLMSGWTKPVPVDKEKVAKALAKEQEVIACSQLSATPPPPVIPSSLDSTGTDVDGDVIPATQTAVLDTSGGEGQENRKVPNGCENQNDDDVFMKPAAKKPRLSVDCGLKSSVLSAIPPPPPLQLAPNVPPPETAVRVMFTGFQAGKFDDLIDIVVKLGGKVTSNHKECTHIIVNSLPIRTVKYLLALNYADHVVNHHWLGECKKMKRFVAEDSFGFKSAKESIKRRNDRPYEKRLLFSNMVFYITPGCTPSPSVLNNLIDMAGGAGVTSVGPTRRQLTNMRFDGLDFNVIAVPGDLHLCTKYKQWGVKILHPEFLLTSLMRQEMDFEEESFHVRPNQET